AGLVDVRVHACGFTGGGVASRPPNLGTRVPANNPVRHGSGKLLPGSFWPARRLTGDSATPLVNGRSAPSIRPGEGHHPPVRGVLDRLAAKARQPRAVAREHRAPSRGRIVRRVLPRAAVATGEADPVLPGPALDLVHHPEEHRPSRVELAIQLRALESAG